MDKTYTILGAIFICASIAFGAFGAHGLKNILTLAEMDSFEVGVRYQIYHGIALFVLGLNAGKVSLQSFIIIGFTIGVTLFSGSIYLLSVDRALGLDCSFLGPITPIGGLTLITTWILLIIQIARSKEYY
tara:strand:+ start:25513 stop:25902 length:390 start_codon:yes stop_codon:yes gene_type:complete